MNAVIKEEDIFIYRKYMGHVPTFNNSIQLQLQYDVSQVFCFLDKCGFCRSGALKEEYDRLKIEVAQAEADMQHTYNKKRNITMERKEARLEKEEAEKYQRLKEELVSLLLPLSTL